MLRNYWNAKVPGGLKSVEATLRYLYWNDLELSKKTRFGGASEQMWLGRVLPDLSIPYNWLFAQTREDDDTLWEAGDASIISTSTDMAKVAGFVLRKGALPNGRRLVSEKNWTEWVCKDWLPKVNGKKMV